MTAFSSLDEAQLFFNLVNHRSSKSFSQLFNISQTKLWRKIDHLESKFKTRLFYRQSRGTLELTKEGLALYNLLFLSAKKIESSNKTSSKALTISILSPVYITNLFCKHQMFSSYNNKYNVRFLAYSSFTDKINSVALDNDVLLNLAVSCDIVFKVHQSQEYFSYSNWEKVVTLVSYSYLYATEEYFNKHPHIHSPDDLIHHKYIMNKSGSDQILLYQTEKNRKVKNANVNPYLTSDNHLVRLEMINKNWGITHLPENMALTMGKAQYVKILPEYYTEPVFVTVYKKVHNQQDMTHATDDFIENFKKTFSELNNQQSLEECRYV